MERTNLVHEAQCFALCLNTELWACAVGLVVATNESIMEEQFIQEDIHRQSRK
jgi:hypothetical protein